MQPIFFNLKLELPLVKCNVQAGNYGAFAKRFHEIIVSPASHPLHSYIHLIDARHDQKRNMRMELMNFCEEFQAIDAGHVEIGNYRVEMLTIQVGECFFSIAGRGAIESWRCEDK
jgi:hypothetical protein